MNLWPNGLCWGCGRKCRHAQWCPELARQTEFSQPGWKLRAKEKRELAKLMRQQEKEMKLRHHFQPPEWPKSLGRVLSYSKVPSTKVLSMRRQVSSLFEIWENEGHILGKIA